jgi:cobalt/nickel transport system permease protein
MSHLHVPDGVFPLWLISVGWVLAFALVGLSVVRANRLDLRRRVPLVGAVAALMLVAMSSEIVPLAYHINLTIVAGILIGPTLAPITALVAVTVLALLGHGGVTVIGLNTVVISVEIALGWALFHAFVRLLGRDRTGWSSAIATVLTLATTTTLVIGIVALGGSSATTRESGAFDPQTLSFSNPFSEGVVSNAVVATEDVQEAPPIRIGQFALMVYLLGSVGWVIEALITAAIVGFIARVRPGLVFEGAVSQPPGAPSGDEGVHHSWT